MGVHGAGGAPRQAQVMFARRGTGMEDRNGTEYISVVRNTFLSAGMPILPALPFPQATHGLAGGRRRRHGCAMNVGLQNDFAIKWPAEVFD